MSNEHFSALFLGPTVGPNLATAGILVCRLLLMVFLWLLVF